MVTDIIRVYMITIMLYLTAAIYSQSASKLVCQSITHRVSLTVTLKFLILPSPLQKTQYCSFLLAKLRCTSSVHDSVKWFNLSVCGQSPRSPWCFQGPDIISHFAVQAWCCLQGLGISKGTRRTLMGRWKDVWWFQTNPSVTYWPLSWECVHAVGSSLDLF